MRRAVSLALAGLAVWAAPALADAGIALDVDGRAISIGADQLAAGADVAATTYVLDGAAQVLSGTSLRRVLELAGVDPDAISAVTASADLELLQLTRPDVAAVPPFPEGPALVWVDGEGRTTLLRPATASGRAAQVLRSAPGAPLEASVDGAALVEVAIIASVEEARVRQRVPLMAQSSADDATYTWDFGDGTRAEGEQVEHRFARSGRYRVTVTASGGGTSRPVTIVVDAPERRAADPVRTPDRTRDPEPAPAAAPPPASAVAPAPKPKPRRSATAPARPRRAAASRSDPGAVSGTLLADVTAPQSLTVRQAAAAAPAPRSDGGRVPPILWIGLATVAALALGVVAERRRRL